MQLRVSLLMCARPASYDWFTSLRSYVFNCIWSLDLRAKAEGRRLRSEELESVQSIVSWFG